MVLPQPFPPHCQRSSCQQRERCSRKKKHLSYHSELIGWCAILEQNIDYMGVSLLSCLMQGGVAILNRKENRKNVKEGSPQHPTNKETKIKRRQIQVYARRMETHLCFGINFCKLLQEEIDYFYVSIVAANMQWSVSHLELNRHKRRWERKLINIWENDAFAGNKSSSSTWI